MDVVEERCGGADLGKTDVKVCIRVPGAEQARPLGQLGDRGAVPTTGPGA